MKTVVIVGGGFSGTIAAVNLARFCEGTLRVRLVNHGYPLGRGVAYGTRRPEHLLNVAARNMSALADHPHHFVDWLRTRTEYAELPEAELRETFAPRRVYGDYLRGLLQWYSAPVDGRSGALIETIAGEVVDVVPGPAGCFVRLADGTAWEADKVLLATGNQPPAELPCAPGFAHPAYASNPWDGCEQRLPAEHETAVLLGTGLTAADAFLTLTALGHRGPIVAVSRHGWLPQSHFKGIEYPEFPPEDPTPLRLAALVELLEMHCARLQERGANPAIVVDKLRPFTQRIWRNLSLDERRTFCRQYAPRWNVLRHRVAQRIHEQLTAALDDGRLRIVAGNILRLESAGPRVRVCVEPRAGDPLMLDSGLVVNCTGPQTSFTAAATPLFRNLLERGLAVADDLDMGLQADDDFALRDADGRTSPFLYAIGPLLRGTLWETTAVPELRGQALRVAQTLLEACDAAQARPTPWPMQDSLELLEYCI